MRLDVGRIEPGALLAVQRLQLQPEPRLGRPHDEHPADKSDPAVEVDLVPLFVEVNIRASTGAPSGYASLGPFGGDGKVLVGTLTPADISWTTSLARNLNNVNIPGLFNAAHVQQFGSVNVLVNSPPTDPPHQTYANTDPALAGWDFHDTYFVTIPAAKLASLGFNSSWLVQPEHLGACTTRPAKPCPPPVRVAGLSW